jgi:hypothetical protein
LGGSVPSRTNAGTRYAGDEQSATWDEWGAVMGAIYAADPDARMGGTSKRPTYGNADHFHFQTGDRFRGRVELNRPAVTADAPTTYLPADTHPRHRWVYQGKTPALAIVHECSECSAITRRADFDTFASKIGA